MDAQWQQMSRHMYPWIRTVEKILSAGAIPDLSGSLINIFSDYSGQHKGSKYEVISILYLDLDGSSNWELDRRAIRKEFLPDARRLSFKSLNDGYKQRALIPFLKAANEINGLLVTVVINKSISNLCVDNNNFDKAKKTFNLGSVWKLNDLEKALRVIHIIGLLIGGLSKKHQDIYWISDEDTLFANITRTQDLGLIIGKITTLYTQHELGQLGFGTTTIDPGDRFEEDAVAIADLVAGGVAEAVNTIALQSGGKISPTIAIPFYGRFSQKTELITSWVWSSVGRLVKKVVLIENINGSYAVSKWDMQNN